MDTSDRKIWECCPNCDDREFRLHEDLIGNGVCKYCCGSGVEENTVLSAVYSIGTDTPLECYYCNGTGQCQTCGGEGRVKKERFEEVSEEDNDDADDTDDDADYTEDDDYNYKTEYSYSASSPSNTYDKSSSKSGDNVSTFIFSIGGAFLLTFLAGAIIGFGKGCVSSADNQDYSVSGPFKYIVPTGLTYGKIGLLIGIIIGFIIILKKK